MEKAECEPLNKLSHVVEILSQLFMNIPFSAIHVAAQSLSVL
jgi:hypothetical protein